MRRESSRPQRVDDRLHAGRGLGGVGRAVADVVRSNHDDDDLRRQADQFPVSQAPEDVFGAIAAEPEVRGLERCEMLFQAGCPSHP